MDGRLALAEVGWLKFPKLMHMGWAGQWLLYEAELAANLSRPALVVPVFEDQVRSSAPTCCTCDNAEVYHVVVVAISRKVTGICSC